MDKPTTTIPGYLGLLLPGTKDDEWAKRILERNRKAQQADPELARAVQEKDANLQARADRQLHRSWAEAKRQEACENGDPTTGVDAWVITGLSPNDRKRIKVKLLDAHAAFCKAPENPTPRAVATDVMRQAFNGIARVLFDADILTEHILKNELQLFVLKAAVAGDWFWFDSDTRDKTLIARWFGVFAAQVSEWRSKLLRAATDSTEHALAQSEGRPRRGRPRQTPNNHPEVETFLLAVSKYAKRDITIMEFCWVSGFKDDTTFGFWRSGNTKRCSQGHASRFEATLKLTPLKFLAKLPEAIPQT